MATYAATINKVEVFGHRKIMDISLVATGTYTTGGDVITAATLGLDVVDFLIPVLDTGAGAQTNGVGVPAWNSSAGKLQLFIQLGAAAGVNATMVELANAVTITGLGIRAQVYGVA